MSLSLLQDILDRTPSWMRRFNRKYQTTTVLRMNEVLRARGLSQAEVAERAGWKRPYVSRVLSGRENLTLRTVARFEDAVGADVLNVTSGPPADAHRPGAAAGPAYAPASVLVTRHEVTRVATAASGQPAAPFLADPALRLRSFAHAFAPYQEFGLAPTEN